MVTSILLPLWLPFIVVTIPTSWVLWRDYRRYPRGHCQACGYNLKGNVSGKCPECGTPIPKDEKEPEQTTNPPQQ